MARHDREASNLIPLLLALVGVAAIAFILVLLAIRDGLVGLLAGLALVGLTSLVTLYFGRVRSASQTASSGHPIFEILSGTIKLIEGNQGKAKPPPSPSSDVTQKAIVILDLVPGMTAAHPRDFDQAIAVARLKDGTTVKTWKNPVGCDHVFLADSKGQMVYGGYVGWVHSQDFQKAIVQIKCELT